MTSRTLEQLRRNLLAQRAGLLERWRQLLSDESEILDATDAPDSTDAAAASTAETIVDAIGAQARGALARIQSSLARIERGTYDECVACHRRIDEERLRAVPDTDRCGGCAPKLN
jgi:RNA polymerase-binding transcription factor DksA